MVKFSSLLYPPPLIRLIAVNRLRDVFCDVTGLARVHGFLTEVEFLCKRMCKKIASDEIMECLQEQLELQRY